MHNIGGRCGPLCQHPGCWESGKKKIAGQKHTRYSSYLHDLLHRLPPSSEQDISSHFVGLPVLTVHSLSLEGEQKKIHYTPFPLNHHLRRWSDPPVPTPQSHQPHYVDILLKEDTTFPYSPSSISSSSSVRSALSFSPHFVWRPGMRRKRTNSPSIQLAHQLELHRESGGRAVGVHNLADVLPPDKASGSGGGQRKVGPRSVRTWKRKIFDPECVDFLYDIPSHIVAEILDQLRSESCSSTNCTATLSRSSAPPTPHTPHNHPPPSSTHHSPTPTPHTHTSLTRTHNPHTPHTHTPIPRTPHTHTPIPRTPHTHTPIPHTPHTHTPTPHTPHTDTPNPHTPHTHTPTPHTPHTDTPNPHTPHTHTPNPHTSHTHTPNPHTPDPHSPPHLNTHSIDPNLPTYNRKTTKLPPEKATHIPSSIMYDLTTGEVHRTLPQVTKSLFPAQCMHFSAHHPPQLGTHRKKQSRRMLQPQTKMTSFSRELSLRPLAVLRGAEGTRPPLTQHRAPQLHHISLSPPSPGHMIQIAPHRVCYPLSNPVAPHLLPPPPPPPTSHLSVSEGPSTHKERDNDSQETHFPSLTVHMPSADRTVTSAFSEETAISTSEPLPASDHNKTSLPSSPSTSPSPSSSSLTRVSPDHMQVGVCIHGNQLVVDREGEEVVHLLKEPSTTNIPNCSPSHMPPLSVDNVPKPTPSAGIRSEVS